MTIAPLAELPGHTEAVFSVTWSHAGSQLASGSADGTVRLWDTASYQQGRSWQVPDEQYVSSVQFSHDDSHLAVGGFDAHNLTGQTTVWDAETGELLQTLVEPRTAWQLGWPWKLQPGSCAVRFHPADRDEISVATFHRRITRWKQGRRVLRLVGHRGLPWLPIPKPVWTLDYSPDGSKLASGGADHRVLIWDAGVKRPSVLRGHRGHVRGVAFSPDGESLASVSTDGLGLIWNVQRQVPRAILEPHAGELTCVAFSPTGRLLATGGMDAQIRIWEAATGTLRWTLTAHEKFVVGLAFSPDGKVLATSGGDDQILLWDLTVLDLAVETAAQS